MGMEQFYNEFHNMPNEQQQEILKAIMFLMQTDNNLNFKTEIANPPIHATLDLLGEYYKDLGQTDASKYIKSFSTKLKQMMVSNKRKGREEMKEILSAYVQSMKRSFEDKMLGRNKE